MSNPIDLTTLQPWIIRPGDKVILQSDSPTLPLNVVQDIKAKWHEQFGDIPVLVVASHRNVTAIIREEEQPTPKG